MSPTEKIRKAVVDVSDVFDEMKLTPAEGLSVAVTVLGAALAVTCHDNPNAETLRATVIKMVSDRSKVSMIDLFKSLPARDGVSN